MGRKKTSPFIRVSIKKSKKCAKKCKGSPDFPFCYTFCMTDGRSMWK